LYERRLGGRRHALRQDNFHWHISGPHFRDYCLLLDEQGEKTLRNADLTWLIVSPSATSRANITITRGYIQSIFSRHRRGISRPGVRRREIWRSALYVATAGFR